MTVRLELDGRSLTLEALASIARGEELEVTLAPSALDGVRRSRAQVERHVDAGDVVYGLTTGFGKLKNVAVGRGDLRELQRNLILSHCCGVGAPMPTHEVRIAQVLRLNGLVRGHSGVRVELLEKLARLCSKGFVPVVPQQGSVGASGDLAPLAHMAATLLGEGEVVLWSPTGERRTTATEALVAVGEEPEELLAKEGLALVNGIEIMKAIGTATWLRAANLSKAADAIASLTIEALLGSVKPFDDRLADLKGHAGHRRTSANVRACMQHSEVLTSHADCDRVQDPYSLRCVPQIHGAFKAALEHVGSILSTELNGVTDNPVLFPDTEEVISAGLFHGQPVAIPLDYLGLSLATLANVSERRVEQLVNPDLSRLPAFLTPRPGVHSGMMIAQVTAAALASENKGLAHPASVDTIPTSANQEDHVSMGVTAARKARTICDNVEQVLAIEYLCAAQAHEFHLDLRAGDGAQAAYDLLRESVPALDGDRVLQPDIAAAHGLIASGQLVAAVEAAVGALAH
jgi:histidine ammonia-lyase